MLVSLQAVGYKVLTSWAFWIVVLFAVTGTLIQLRGRVRLKLKRQIFDHSTFAAPYNLLMYAFSAKPTTPYVDVREFPDLKPLADNWQLLRDEGLKLFDEGHIKAAEKYNDAGFHTFFRTGWKRFYLKWYEDPLPSARALCPRAAELVNTIPSLNAAMYALLPPGARLGAHRDPFATSLRYHLGLVTPNSPDCWIAVDGERYYWKDGEAVIFDETYVHTAENRTPTTRIILLCDIERPLTNRFLRWVNHYIGHGLVRAGAAPNQVGDKEGVLSTVAEYFHKFQKLGRRVKDWNYPTYYIGKKVLLAGILYLIFFH
ncbi:MAG TPA: aspartyl/asparaginyl beta-hydroxylase domain-containing protein [Gammaproteobacteria bacterium]|nr:aspartyl/asparaginyl beta-hydroxylase domain-containing protein [Gammaproteobacteria bacterium]